MDNLYFKKLPSEVLPTVTGDNVVLVETASGRLYRIDSGGAKQLVDMDMAFPVGIHVEQLFGEPTPAERFGNTWELDSDYAGRVTIGSGGGYTFGDTGGEATHTQTVQEMAQHSHPIKLVQSGGTSTTSLFPLAQSDWIERSANTGNAGGGQPMNIMQPYKVSNWWKRIA